MQSIHTHRPVYGFDHLRSVQQSAPASGDDVAASLLRDASTTHTTIRAQSSDRTSTLRPSSGTHTALLVTADRKYQVSTTFPTPQALGPYEVLIRTRAVGLNHIDWKSVDYNFCLPSLPWITGREMAGVVERVGAKVLNARVGQRVWTSTYYKDRRAGCFQELVVVPQHTVFEIPSHLDFNAAACLGVPALTAAMTLWRWLDVPMPIGLDQARPLFSTSRTSADPSNEFLLIWGASTATGQFCIQIAALAGIHTIAVCSEATASLVSNLGATHVVTYTGKTDLHLIVEVLSVAQGKLRRAIDLVGPATASVVLEIIKICGDSHLVDFASLGFLAKNQVLPVNARLQDVQMKQFVLDPTARVYGERLNQLLEANVLRLPKLRELKGGLWMVEKGLEMVKNGNLGGEKLVVSFA